MSAPKDNEESSYAPRMLKLVLTDGQATCNALEMEKLERIGFDIQVYCLLPEEGFRSIICQSINCFFCNLA